MLTDKYRQISDLPHQIPLFPLRGAFLLPRATLPLNIFEPRYLAMIDHILAGRRVLGMIQPQSLGDDEESPDGKVVPLRRIGCAGRLTSYQELDDGRLLITLTGLCRFQIAEERETTEPFRMFKVDYAPFADDLTPGFGERDVDRDMLHRVLKSYLDSNRLTADWRAIANAPTEMLVNALSVISPFGDEEKQALLEARTLKDRAAVLVALAEMELAAGEGSSGGGRLQ